MGTAVEAKKGQPYRYEQVAEQMARQIRAGRYRRGERIPGTRLLAEMYGVSINTVLQAQKILENQGLIEAIPRSGFFVKGYREDTLKPTRRPGFSQAAPTLVRRQRLALDLLQATGNRALVQLGAALPHDSYFPADELRRIGARVARSGNSGAMCYQVPPGLPSLCESLALRMLGYGCEVAGSEIVITNGCQEALLIALKCVTEPGDVVLLESPVYYGLLQMVDTLGLRAVEIPCEPEYGMDLQEVEAACRQWEVKACVVVGSFSNPMGYCPDNSQKQALVSLLNDFNIPLIEDDIYGDLAFDGHRPFPYKHFDRSGEILYCSSFSKSVSPGIRVGWLSPGRYAEKAAYLKFTQNIASPAWNQKVLDEYLRNGGADRHIRKIRRIYAVNMGRAVDLIRTTFPEGTRTSQPQGGFVLWVELPEEFDSAELYRRALECHISISPGFLFSCNGQFRHHFRINCALPWDSILEPAIKKLGKLLD